MFRTSELEILKSKYLGHLFEWTSRKSKFRNLGLLSFLVYLNCTLGYGTQWPASPLGILFSKIYGIWQDGVLRFNTIFLYDHFYSSLEPEPLAQGPMIYLAVPLFEFGEISIFSKTFGPGMSGEDGVIKFTIYDSLIHLYTKLG